MKALWLKGQVFSGKGEGAEFVNLDWAKRQIEDKLGFRVFLGTLNLRLDRESVKKREKLKDEGFEIVPKLGYCRARLLKARVRGTLCGIIIPYMADYPQDVLEVVSSVNLREKLCLSDGSWLEVEVTS